MKEMNLVEEDKCE